MPNTAHFHSEKKSADLKSGHEMGEIADDEDDISEKIDDDDDYEDD